ncbi:Co-chaperone protein HscB [Candidatus Profftia lariciata]|uniref:Fe-S protein assembly co-chaperone HscB n=1 Tax=Candidatus Profftia lariciata TaxID=1987921 RepID=UPI001D029E66|nr:Fe-S protein assembly co-chaperone HscB [Candidatus Profftia lariciata]UDG81800.1 Co-chaperone protein HscB [Candidatus Profftia lariciata]
MDYFTLFKLPVCYLINNDLLMLRYQELQRQFHPDRYVNQLEHKCINNIQQSATINNAYYTLKHPLKRAAYILSLKGYYLNNTQYIKYDKLFIAEQLKLREDLNKIALQTNPEKKLVSFKFKISQIIKKHSAQMIIELEQQQWNSAINILCKLSFLDKLQQQINKLEEDIIGL